jgi:hypothetical protein
MKLLGGQWSKGDFLALLGVIAAILAIPGMPKLFHWDSDASHGPAIIADPKIPAPVRVPKSADVSSGQVNFGCEESQDVKTPVVSFGKNPADIKPTPSWEHTDNVKSQNQSVENIEDPATHAIIGIKATGRITGRDKQAPFGNCPGGGHGELRLQVSWTEQPY